MLISFSHRFVFIHVQRTGGSSIISTLRPLGHEVPKTRWKKLLTRAGLVKDPREMAFRTHETAQGVRRLLPADMYAEFLMIAFVRNPWSWLVSLYEVFRKGPRHRHHRIVARMHDFREYVDWEAARNKRFMYPMVTDNAGRIMVDFLGHFEHLEADHRRLCTRLGIEPVELPRRNRRTFRDYREYYDDATREQVGEVWQRDIALFGYEFDGLRAEVARPSAA